MLITIKEYAELHALSYGTVRNAIYKGKFTPDKKVNGVWYVEKNKKWYASKHYNKLGEKNSYSRVYNIWRCMKQRCYNPNHSAYYRYGGRGIKVCDRWVNDSKAFITWALNNGYDNTLELDRIDNDGDYCPTNCQWITHKENQHKAPKGTAYKDYNSRMARLYYEMKRNNIDTEKYGVKNPFT